METEDHHVQDQQEWGQGGAGKTRDAASSLPPTAAYQGLTLILPLLCCLGCLLPHLLLPLPSNYLNMFSGYFVQKESLSVAEEKYTASNLLLQKITSLPAAHPRQRSSAEPRKARQAAAMADLASTGT